MAMVLTLFISSVFVLLSLTCPCEGADTKPHKFKDSPTEIMMPPGHLGEGGKSAPGLSTSKQQPMPSNTAQLIIKRMELLEKNLEFMEMRLKLLEGGKK